MKSIIKHLQRNLLLCIIAAFFIFFSILFPEIQIDISGGFAWFVVVMSNIVGLSLIYCCVFGGEVSIKADGIIPIIKRYMKKSEK